MSNEQLLELLKKARWVISVSAHDCEHLLHANKSEQHRWSRDPCPVEAKVQAIIEQIDELLGYNYPPPGESNDRQRKANDLHSL